MAAILGVCRVCLASRGGAAALPFQHPRDPLAQRLRRLLVAPVAHHQTQLGLEVVGLEAGRAVVEVALDVLAVLVGELTVEVLVQLPKGLVAVAVGHGGFLGQLSVVEAVGTGSSPGRSSGCSGGTARPWDTA